MKKVFAALLCIILLFASSVTLTGTVEAATISDIKTNDSKYTAAKWAVDKGVIKLQTGRKFNKSTAITEADLLKAFATLDKNYPYQITNDMVYNHYGELFIPVKGATDKSKRNAGLTRGEFAVIYAAMFGLDLSEVQAVRYLYLNEITTGTTKAKTYESYNPKGKLSRGDAAVFLYRMNKKKRLASEGLDAKATGSDNKKVTIPSSFKKSDTGEVEVPVSDSGSNDTAGNISDVLKEVQSLSVSNPTLIANGKDYTRVSISLKNSYGESIDYKESLQFKVTSRYNESDVVSTSAEADSYVKIAPNPGNATASTVWSDGGELSFYVTAPKTTKSYKDTIYVELVSTNDKAYASFKNKRIEANVQYVPQPELRVTYQVYDAYSAEFIDNKNPIQDKWAVLPSTIPPGPVSLYQLDKDEKTFRLTTTTTAANGITVGYEGASLSLAGYPISEFLFEKIVEQYFSQTSVGTSTLGIVMSADVNGNAAYDLPFAIVPNRYTSEFSSGDPEEYAVVAYLLSLLPSSINEFSMSYYDSVKKLQAIFTSIPSSTVDRVAGLSKLKTPISGLIQLADTEYKNQQDAQKAKQTSHTKVMVSLVAPGGQIITNYRGPVVIEYNGVRQQVMFTANTSTVISQGGHAGAAVAVFDDLIYGDSTVNVTLPYYSGDTRYTKLLESIYDKPQKSTITATKAIDDRACLLYAEVAVVVDSSGSMSKNDPTNEVGRLAKDLIKKMEGDPTIAVRYNTSGLLEKKGTSASVLQMDQSLFSLGNRKGGTSMLAGVQTAINQFSSLRDNSVRKAIVIVSDGHTNSSEVSQIINLANQNNIKIHTITLGSQQDGDTALMKRIALETDGSTSIAKNDKALSAAFQLVYDQLACNFDSSNEVCSNLNAFEDAQVSIGEQNVYIYTALNENCKNIATVQVKFTSGNADAVFTLKSIGANHFEYSFNKNRIDSFAINNTAQLIALNAEAEIIYTSRIQVQ